MSLTPEDKKKTADQSIEAVIEEPQKVQSKREKAEELALKYKKEDYSVRRSKIMEEVPCSKSVAVKAMLKIDGGEERESKPSKPDFKVVIEEKKEPLYLPPTGKLKGKEERLEEISPEGRRPEKEGLTPEEAQEQLDLFRDMLRGIHVLILADGGIVDLLTKAGRPEKQVKEVSDQLYRWLLRRYSVEDLERFDTILLIASYGTLIGGIIQQVISDRNKKEEKKERKEDVQKT